MSSDSFRTVSGAGPIFQRECIKVVQRIEQEMWMDLRFEELQFCLQFFLRQAPVARC